jgi:hypothetical protein
MRIVFWWFFMNNDETRGKIEKSKGKIMGDKSDRLKVK